MYAIKDSINFTLPGEVNTALSFLFRRLVLSAYDACVTDLKRGQPPPLILHLHVCASYRMGRIVVISGIVSLFVRGSWVARDDSSSLASMADVSSVCSKTRLLMWRLIHYTV